MRTPMPELRLALLVLTLVLAACGAPAPGGNGVPNDDDTNDQPPAAPTLTLTPTAIKTFHFTWPTTDRANEYRLLEDPTGSSDLEPIATLPANTTSYTHEVALPARINARYQLQACNQHGCTPSDIVPVTGTLSAAVGYVKASNTRAGAGFGLSVALSGDGTTLAVGAPLETSNATGIDGDQANDDALGAGAVYVFVRTGTSTWQQQGYVKASNTALQSSFGSSIALSYDGNTLVVGAPDESGASTGINGDESSGIFTSGAGAAYVFTRLAGTWSQQAYVKASNTGQSHRFGTSVAMSDDGNTLAVGAPGEDSRSTGIDSDPIAGIDGAVGAGAVYVYTRSAGTWTQQAYVKASNTNAGHAFGHSVALSADGNTLAVGATGEASSATGIDGDQTNAAAPNSGAVYVFVQRSGRWAQQAYVKASNTQTGDAFGHSVALSADGTTLAVGAPAESSDATGINGDQRNDDAPSAGAVYLFARSTAGRWTQQAYVKASTTDQFARFGESVALSADGTTLAVGAGFDGTNATGVNAAGRYDLTTLAGAVYRFVRTDGTWRAQSLIKPIEIDHVTWFGRSVSLSADGGTLAVGAPAESSNATGISGDSTDRSASSAGAAYLY